MRRFPSSQLRSAAYRVIFSPWVNQPRHLRLITVVKNEWICTSTPPYALMMGTGQPSSVTFWTFFYDIWYDIYLLTAIGLPRGGSCTIHIYTQTVHRTTQNKQYVEQHKIWEQYKNFGIVRAVPRLGELYLGICLATEEKAWKPLSQGSRTIRIRKPKNKIT